jgi:hypothetical protein
MYKHQPAGSKEKTDQISYKQTIHFLFGRPEEINPTGPGTKGGLRQA